MLLSVLCTRLRTSFFLGYIVHTDDAPEQAIGLCLHCQTSAGVAFTTAKHGRGALQSVRGYLQERGSRSMKGTTCINAEKSFRMQWPPPKVTVS